MQNQDVRMGPVVQNIQLCNLQNDQEDRIQVFTECDGDNIYVNMHKRACTEDEYNISKSMFTITVQSDRSITWTDVFGREIFCISQEPQQAKSTESTNSL